MRSAHTLLSLNGNINIFFIKRNNYVYVMRGLFAWYGGDEKQRTFLIDTYLHLLITHYFLLQPPFFCAQTQMTLINLNLKKHMFNYYYSQYNLYFIYLHILL